MGSTCDKGMYAFSDKLQSHLLDDEAFFYIIDFNDMASSSKSYQSSKINNWKQSGDHSINVKRFVKKTYMLIFLCQIRLLFFVLPCDLK